MNITNTIIFDSFRLFFFSLFYFCSFRFCVCYQTSRTDVTPRVCLWRTWRRYTKSSVTSPVMLNNSRWPVSSASPILFGRAVERIRVLGAVNTLNANWNYGKWAQRNSCRRCWPPQIRISVIGKIKCNLTFFLSDCFFHKKLSLLILFDYSQFLN